MEYLESIVKLDFDWAKEPSESTVYGQDKASHASYHFPIYHTIVEDDEMDTNAVDLEDCNQDTSEWTKAFLYDAKAIAVPTQTHTHSATCRKKGTACRFGFAGVGKTLCATTTIDPESGQIENKRTNAMANNHNPSIAAVIRSNHDLKPTFLSGYKSLQSMYYMTSYVSKFEDDKSNAVIMEATWRGLERDGILPTTDDQERLNRLIIRLSYLCQSSLQFSSAKIAAMFLDIGTEGTHYTNCKFSRVSLYTLINYYESVDLTCQRVTLLWRGQGWMQKGPEISWSRDNTKNARIEGINELMLQAKVPENHDRLEVVPRALNLTKSPRHLTQCATHSNCPQMPPHTLTPRSRTNYHELAALHHDEVPHLSELLHLDESTNSVHDKWVFDAIFNDLMK
jgi:hypothetical protein